MTGTSYVDTGAPAGAASYYQVTAVDLSGNESARSATVNATRPAAARPTIRINAGGPAVTTGGLTWNACSAVGTACTQPGHRRLRLQRERHRHRHPGRAEQRDLPDRSGTAAATGTGVVPVGQRAFGFAVPVANGAYQVRLHFAELNKTGANQRTFDVRLENTTVLSNFDIWTAAGGIDKAISGSSTSRHRRVDDHRLHPPHPERQGQRHRDHPGQLTPPRFGDAVRPPRAVSSSRHLSPASSIRRRAQDQVCAAPRTWRAGPAYLQWTKPWGSRASLTFSGVATAENVRFPRLTGESCTR